MCCLTLPVRAGLTGLQSLSLTRLAQVPEYADCAEDTYKEPLERNPCAPAGLFKPSILSMTALTRLQLAPGCSKALLPLLPTRLIELELPNMLDETDEQPPLQLGHVAALTLLALDRLPRRELQFSVDLGCYQSVDWAQDAAGYVSLSGRRCPAGWCQGSVCLRRCLGAAPYRPVAPASACCWQPQQQQHVTLCIAPGGGPAAAAACCAA